MIPDVSLYRRTDPDTSRQAATLAQLTAGTVRERCYLTLLTHPEGLTDFELADLVGRQQTSAGKRRGDLVAVGLVEDSGERRRTPSGASAIVWRLVKVP